MVTKKLSKSLFSLLRKMRPKFREGAEIRKSEEETGNERVLEKRREWRRGSEYESGSGICGDSLTSPWL